jgi:hypothetical protein
MNTTVGNETEKSTSSNLGSATGMNSAMEDSIFGINFDDSDCTEFGSVGDAWFSQQVVNTDWFGMT